MDILDAYELGHDEVWTAPGEPEHDSLWCDHCGVYHAGECDE